LPATPFYFESQLAHEGRLAEGIPQSGASAVPADRQSMPIEMRSLGGHVECFAENGGGVDTPVLRLAVYYRRIIASTAFAKPFRHGVYRSLRLSDSPEALNGDSRLSQ
jgi:hypothetical protein